MEIDVRDSKSSEQVDIIRFSDEGVIERCIKHWYISAYPGDYQFQILEEEIDDLITALKKLKEIY